jgi:hypothetical protein
MSPDAILRSVRAAIGQPVVSWLLGLKGVYLAIVLGAVWIWNDFDTQKFYSVNARWPREGGPVFASHFATWDAAHYLYLSEVGYGKGAPSCAFPMFIALGVFLGRRQWRWLRWGLLAVFGVLHLVLVWRFVNFRWAG